MDIWVVAVFWLLWVMMLYEYYIFAWLYVFNSLGVFITICWVIWLLFVEPFEKLQIVLQSSCIILRSHQQLYEDSNFSTPSLHMWLSAFSILVILVDVNFTVVLICISLVANDVEHLFTCLLVTCTSSIHTVCPYFLNVVKLCCRLASVSSWGTQWAAHEVIWRSRHCHPLWDLRISPWISFT